ncbi:formate--tetrahydrofolate ligase [Latilactobacillus sakei subsp. carnosus]|uniref:formate--tetrahydrofolate ligase n=1 Tax=Latilactobacillus TaxID=2767885 RepID=UPI000C127419|nr:MULTISPECIES: formate--tetrahydrofolate ligase [Latilactobacillus]MCM1570600.1 formate--tetrahydrofolate ligase [Latilactobacillus sakei]MCP8852825.1 formate--tetrahydrofolate ligase [Latilactobacillus sakei]MDV8937198.1 formate--tetrahydrofolate ligase [Latilactobacillus sp.]MDV8938737.1 formate--tetrahydrofolate ligase [Latilactobacillus sp.]MDV8940719.1 formate--tetrahydrofolate ligase [Latilactobacillus sp.]
MSDIQIAQANEATEMKSITAIAEQIGLQATDIEQYGPYKAKLNFQAINRLKEKEDGKLVLVTSINPTPAGEGKSTVTVGLGDALRQLDQSAVIALREPSLGPVMGMKGGATGGGYAQVVPMADINLHFTGDMHALTATVNTLAALIDNHLQQGNVLNIDPRRIIWKRALDINDRALRQVVIGLGGPVQGMPRQDGFDITVASELMAILCLATDITDLKNRISKIVIGYNYDREPVTVGDLEVTGAIAMLLKDALKPNMVQTLEHTPALVHGGPFANIAHGCNSILATQTALKLGDIAITEAGFGADLGAEKFLDIKVPQLGKTPDTIVIVATIRALKYNGGVALADLTTENLDALKAGFSNLAKHIANMQRYGVPVVVSVNEFISDTAAEVQLLQDLCQAMKVTAVPTSVWANGGQGGIELAKAVLAALQQPKAFKPLYDPQADIKSKLTTVVTEIYGGRDVVFEGKAINQLKQIEKNGWAHLPVCIAKTQYSLSDDPKALGAPSDFTIHVRELIPKLGAGFIVAMTGAVLTMPGLPKKPAALNMDVTADGQISGLF